MPHKSTNVAVSTIGIDLGKNSFHLAGLDKRGAIALQIKLSRGQLERRLANIPRSLIGMEACAGAHHIGRRLEALGHDVRLIPAQYAKPFLKGHKSRATRSIAGMPRRLSKRCSGRRCASFASRRPSKWTFWRCIGSVPAWSVSGPG